MRIVSVTAADFGPLQQRTLGLAPGLTVVVGANESGKSSWHAALYAALCGRRRGRGRPGLADQRFIDAHRPWGGAPWTVRAELQLDDGREIEMSQELAGLVDCRAVDLGLGRDVSAEIMHEGSPDASVWCGLTRHTFRATACVGQGEMLAVLDSADGLQGALQRALSAAPNPEGSSTSTSTAAAAIAGLQACRREAVGRDAVASIRPLRRAHTAVAAAEEEVRLAQSAAGELEALCARRDAAARLVASCPAPPPADSCAGPVEASPSRPARGLVAAGAGLAVLLAITGLVVGGPVGLTMFAGAAAVIVGLGSYVVRAGRAQAAEVAGRSARDRAVAGGQSARESALVRHNEARIQLVRAEAELAGRAAAVPPLAAAQERLAAAREELERVRRLDQTLELTIDFLSRAQERVHREVAPGLSASVSARLPAATGGRYSAARIDPADLAVEVRDPSGRFRPARALSHGVAEQIHLILRVALVEVLTAGHDRCPLLLDDVTVHADPDRTDGVLDLLLQIAAERQVVLFAQQDQVRAWAAARLDGVRHALVELEPPDPHPAGVDPGSRAMLRG